MPILLLLVFNILFGAVCGVLGQSKEYSPGYCFAAGFFGGVVALLVIVLLPDQTQSTSTTSQQSYALYALEARIRELEARVAALEGNPSEDLPADLTEISMPDSHRPGGDARHFPRPHGRGHRLPPLRQTPAGRPGLLLRL